MKRYKEFINDPDDEATEDILIESKIGKAAALFFASQHKTNRQRGITELRKTVGYFQSAKRADNILEKSDHISDGLISFARALKIVMDLSGNNISSSTSGILTSENIEKVLQKELSKNQKKRRRK